jgi:hypothetical protein
MRAHKAICRYDNQLIESLADLEIDHIIPESLPADELIALLRRLNKEDLDINSYFNWFPVHRWCNNQKSDILLPDASLHYLLAIAASKEPAVRAEEAKFDRQARANDVLARVARQIELGALSKEAAIAFLEGTPIATPSKADPTILGFSINLAEATETGPRFDSPGETLMQLDDDESTKPCFTPASLQAELEDSLRVLNALTVASQPVQNNGETLSIRYAVWLLNLDSLPTKFPNAWRLLEVAPFSEIYPGGDASSLIYRAVILRRNELIVDQDSPDPLPYRYCPNCGQRKFHRSSIATEKENFYSIRCSSCGWGETF